MRTLKDAIKKIANPGGFVAVIDRAIVLSVDKNELTCTVQQVADDLILEAVKLKPVINDGDLNKMGLILFPAVNSFVTIGQVDDDNLDICILGTTEIESIGLDTSTALKLLISGDGKILLNTVQTVFNDGKNGGIPLLKPLTKAIATLQKQVNDLSDVFAKHTHPGVSSGTDSSLVTLSKVPAKSSLLKEADIENTRITQ